MAKLSTQKRKLIPLNPKKLAILVAIRELTRRHRWAPTLPQIVKETGIPLSSVWRYVDQMEGDWLQRREEGKQRQLVLRREVPMQRTA